MAAMRTINILVTGGGSSATTAALVNHAASRVARTKPNA